jgi:hypothetical protein
MITHNKTVKELIIEDVEKACKAIKRINGFDNNIEVVERWDQKGNDRAAIPCLFIHTGNETKENRPSLITGCTLTVHLDLWTVHDKEKYPGSTDGLLNSFAYDIEKAVMQDIQRNDLAERTTVVSVDLFETVEGQPYAGVIATLEIKYKHKTGDPKTQL